MEITRRLISFTFLPFLILFSASCSLAFNFEASIHADGIAFPAAIEDRAVTNNQKDFGQIVGRKMMVKSVINMNNVGTGVTKVSGKRLQQSAKPLGTPDEHVPKDQSSTNLSKPKTRSSKKAYMNAVDDFQYWKVINEARSDNIMSLLNKDYPGGGYNAHHKPPSNNYQPFDHQSVIP